MNVYCVTGSYHSLVREDFERGLEDLQSAVELSEEAQAFATYAQANFWLGFTLYQLACDFENALNHMGKASQFAVMANNSWVISTIKSNIGMLLYFQGAPSAGLALTAEAVRMAEESGDAFSKCRAYVSHGLCLYGRGLLQEATENLSRGAEFANRVDYLAYNIIAHYHLAEITHAMGDFQKALFHYEEAFRLRERCEFLPSWSRLCKTGVALDNIMNGKPGVDLESLCRDAIKCKPKLIEGWIRRNLGESFLNIYGQHCPEAQHWIERIRIDRESEAIHDLILWLDKPGIT